MSYRVRMRLTIAQCGAVSINLATKHLCAGFKIILIDRIIELIGRPFAVCLSSSSNIYMYIGLCTDAFLLFMKHGY